jgi:hypothetical protein
MIQQTQSIVPKNDDGLLDDDEQDDEDDDDDASLDESNTLALTASTEIVAPPHPIVILSKAKGKSAYMEHNDEWLVDKAIIYLHLHALHTMNCPHISQKKGKYNKCSCMSLFDEEIHEDDDSANPLTKATAQFMVYFAKLDCHCQQQYVMGWYHSASLYWTRVPQRDDGMKGVSPRNFQLPVLCKPEMDVVVQGALPFVCMFTMQLVSGKKVSFGAPA